MIKIKDLTFTYPNGLTALNNFSIDVKKSEFICIIGPSGCGKTTLLNCLAGLLKPTSGQLKIKGKTAMVFQDPLLMPWRNTIKNITYGLEIKKEKPQEILKRAEKIISTLHLNKFENFYPNELSGGMKQRVNIGRALICRPDILLLDEPFSHLDPKIREELQMELLNIYQKEKKTNIFVTHLVEEALFLADKIVVLKKGEKIKIIPVPFTRPRNLSLKDSTSFIKLKNEIRKLI